ncbi:MAG: Endopeptidase, cell wall lytic activity, partial [Parcubacteria group bacterium GW2011_GWA1_54_9]
ATYQAVVDVNVVTNQNTQAEVDTATSNITTAQGDLVLDLIPPVISTQTTASPTETSLTATWTTDHPATSRVIYDTVSHAVLGAAPNYGYANSTVEDTTLVTSHSVTVTGLTADTTYFFRTVSRGSPEAVSDEFSGTTSATPSTSPGNSGGSSGSGPGCAQGTAYNPSTGTCTPIGQVLSVSTESPTSVACAVGDLFNIRTGRACPQGSGQVLGASTFNFTKALTVGVRSDEVTELQKVLIAEGLLKIDAPTGYFGELTRAAVQAYQASRGIADTGFVGPLTRAELNKGTLVSAAASGKPNLTDEQVTSILGVLQSFNADQATVDRVRAALGK